MQIHDRDILDDFEEADDSQIDYGFLRGLGFAPSIEDDDDTLVGSIELDQPPEELDEKDRIGEDTHPRRSRR